MKKYLVIVCLLILCCACRITPDLYRPTDLNMPLPSQKNEVKAKISLNLISGLSGNVSFAADSHLVIFASASSDKSADSKNIHFLNDAGAGLYTSIEDYGKVELLGGIGYGTTFHEIKNKWNWSITSNKTGYEDLIINAALYRGMLKADAGYIGKNINLAVGGRLVENYTNGYYPADYSDSNQRFVKRINIPVSGYSLFFEPGIMVGIGVPFAKFQFQYGISYQLNGVKPVEDFGQLYVSQFVSLGC